MTSYENLGQKQKEKVFKMLVKLCKQLLKETRLEKTAHEARVLIKKVDNNEL